MTLLSIDFETYFDTKLSLNKMTTMEYVRHPDFKVWGVGVRYVGEDTATELYPEFTVSPKSTASPVVDISTYSMTFEKPGAL